MKRLFFSVFALLVFALSVSAQEAAGPKAMKPTIMVVPEKAWCLNKGYVQANNPNAVDYSLALRDDDVLNVVTEMGKIMAERGFPLKLLSSALEALQTEAAMDVALVSKEDGEIMEDDLDKLTRVAGADILVNIAFTRTQRGPRNMIEFRVTSVDAATSKQIGGETGVSSASGAPVTVLLQESVLSFMDNFSAGIQRHFQDIVDNGREGSIIFKIASDCPLNFESEVEYNGDTGELCDLIDYWMSEHAVNGSFSQNGKTRVRLSYEQVRFPLFGKGKFGGKARAINADGFVKPIGSFLSQFGISVSTAPSGIGKVYVVLGGK